MRWPRIVRATTLHIWGEPLLHKRIYDMIAYCSEKGLRSEISTNATLLTEERARKLLDAGLSVIYLCQDGIRPETYENVRVNGDYEKTNENIRRFVEMKHEGGYHNLCQPPDHRNGKAPRTKPRSLSHTGKMSPASIWCMSSRSIPGATRSKRSAPCAATDDRHLPNRFACPNLWYHVHIYWDGSIAMCDRDFNLDFDLGNVIDEDGEVRVMKNWNGPKMQELRRCTRMVNTIRLRRATPAPSGPGGSRSCSVAYGNRPVQDQFEGQSIHTNDNGHQTASVREKQYR